MFYAVSAVYVFQPYNSGDYKLKMISLEILKFAWGPSRAYSSNGLLCTKKVVILDTGHNLTPNPTDVKILEKCKSEKFFKFYVGKITLLQKRQNITGTYLCKKVLYRLYVINMK